MRHRILLAGVICTLAIPLVALAADHADYPGADADPLADITDLYAWTSDDAEDVRLVLGFAPGSTASTAFSDATQYVFHVGNGAGFGEITEERSIVCQPYSESEIECWVLGADGAVLDYVAGDASSEAGIMSDSGNTRLFAGLRNDPFFFNAAGLGVARNTVLAVAGDLEFDDAGCPTVDEATSGVLVGQLQSSADGGDATNTFGGSNVLAIALEVDKSLLTRDGNETLAVWASTHRSAD